MRIRRVEPFFFQFKLLFFPSVSFGGALGGGLLAFLRFEANSLFNPLGSYVLKLLKGFINDPAVCHGKLASAVPESWFL